MTSSLAIVTPQHTCDPGLAIAAARAGETGLLDLGFDHSAATRIDAIRRLGKYVPAGSRWGLRWDTLGQESRRLGILGSWMETSVPVLLIAGSCPEDGPGRLKALLEQGRALGRELLLEVYDVAGATSAVAAGFDGVVFKALESGGRVSESSSYLLLQKIRERLESPFWIQGAWGPDTAAAARLAGAAGVVLGEELWLTRESPLSEEERERFSHLDGSETLLVGPPGCRFRLFGRRDREGLARLGRQGGDPARWPRVLLERWLADDPDREAPLPMGQGIAFAARLARRYVTVGGVLEAFRGQARHHISKVGSQASLGEHSPLARSVGTRYPILQGPMTRVSDTASFCRAVADTGGLPFLALALMRGPEVEKLLAETKQELAGRPWGIGILGFVPPELRQEQIEVVKRHPPGFAVIAGGRPSQARELEAQGIGTYLHVPSPGLLETFLKEGARRFVLEGRECGGHVGPRPSFTLWQSAIDLLLEADLEKPEEIHVVFAGGVHDAFSAAMVRALAVPLADRGVKIGLLMGTAYLFTHEAVRTGAITEEYQRQALACEGTALLSSGVGHETRCARTRFAEEFDARKRTLEEAGRPADQIWFELEMLNVGRLRMASKGVARQPVRTEEVDPGQWTREKQLETGSRILKGDLIEVDTETQRREGMYMIGEVAALRDRTLSMAALHEEVSAGSAREARRLAALRAPAEPAPRPVSSGEPVAIIGMACLFPDSPDVRTYWENILNRFDAIREVSPERWNAGIYYAGDRLARDRVYSKRGGFLGEYRFDPIKYRIPPASLPSMEPIHLLALEVASRALRDAGYETRPFPRERTAVLFAAGGVNDVGIDYAMRTMLPHYLERSEALDGASKARLLDELRGTLPEWTEDSFPGFLANVLSGRIANRLDLKGPNFVVDAACAASLAAVHTATQQLRSRICDMALVGAADGTNNAFTFMAFAKTHALTPGDRVRPFDDRADGILLGEGIAAVVLKRLPDAERDGDRVYAVIRGIGSSSDGRNRSLTAPHPEAQALAIRRAIDDAGVDPDSVSLVEAHATGTAVGDHSEINAMKQVFPRRHEPYCAVGSVKSMIGHTKTAAGLAGMIKTALALDHKVLPPTINVEIPNRKADFENSPFCVNTETRPWIRAETARPRRAGLNAFGFGGTNFHVVMEEYGGEFRRGSRIDYTPRPAEVFAWSRPDRAALEKDLAAYGDSMKKAGGIGLARLAAGVHLDERRRAGGSGGARLGLLATSLEDLRAKLEKALQLLAAGGAPPRNSGLYLSDSKPAEPGQICMLFPGQGSQRVNMLRDLVQYGPAGVEALESADRLLADLLPRGLSSYIFPRPVFDKESAKRQQADLNDTRIAQPALGAMNLYAGDLLDLFGLRPAFAAGHSYGEYVALCAAGFCSRDDLLRISALRGQAVFEVGRDNPGGMAAVAASAPETQEALDALGIEATIANFNGPTQTIIGGSVEAIEAALKRLSQRGLAIRRVAVTAAFHTPAMEEPSRAIAKHLEEIRKEPLRIPVYSNVTAEPYPADPAAVSEQLAVHLARPVRFVEQVRAMHRDGARVFIEAGPGRILTTLVQRILADEPHETLSLDMPGQDGWLSFGHLLAAAHALGLPVELSPWFRDRGLEAVLPGDLPGEIERLQGSSTDWILDCRAARPATPRAGPPRRTPVAVKDDSRPKTTGRPSSEVSGMSRTPPPGPPRPTPATVEIDSRQDATGRPSSEISGTSKTPPPGPRPPAPPPADQPLLAHLQETMSQWLELQRDQQRLNERFLAIQERIAGSLLNGQEASEPARPSAAARRPSRPASEGLAVPPAPVLPNLRPTLDLPPPDPTLIASALESIAPAPEPGDSQSAAPAGGTGLSAAGPSAVDDAPIAEGIPSVETFKRDLLDEVSRRTGYPEEMLALDAQLEAGLGIDSIKTMEIFTALKRYHRILADDDQDDEEVLVKLTEMKTLGDIIGHYRARTVELTSRESLEEAAAKQEEHAGRGTSVSPRMETRAPVERLILKPVPAPPAGQDRDDIDLIEFPRDQILLVLGEAPDLGSSLEGALAAGGYRVALVVMGRETRRISATRFEADLGDRSAVEKLAELIRGPDGARVGGLVNLLTLGETVRAPGLNGYETPLRLVQWLANVARVFEKDIRAGAGSGGGWLVNITTMDGRFGLRGSRSLPIAQAGSLGFFKSLAREWRGVRLKNIDLDPDTEPGTLLVGLLRELASWDSNVEVGLDAEGRWGLELVEQLRDPDEAPGRGAAALGLDGDSVILATGGAHGITAEVLKQIAAETKPRLVIVGRSAITGQEEPEATRHIQEASQLRARLIEVMRAEEISVAPARVESELRRVFKNRAMRKNLDDLRKAGSEVEYHSVDVRSVEDFGRLIDDLYDRYGRIDGVLHGAGVIEDRRLRDKTSESLARVFETKVNGGLILARKLRPEKLKFLVLFSSVSGRFGNAGQADYSAANEFLNKLASHLNREWPGRVVAINWGPWDAGMISDELRSAYRERGIQLIPAAAGARSLLEELRLGKTADAEVVLACSARRIASLSGSSG